MCSGVERAPGSTCTRLTPTVTLPAALPRSVQLDWNAPSSARKGSMSSQCTTCSATSRLDHGCDPGVMGESAPLERVGSEFGSLLLGPEPGLALAQQLADLGEQLLRARALALEGLDPLQPVHDGARLDRKSTRLNSSHVENSY